MLKGIIFDFDGVILESIEVKTRAFAELFSDYPQQINEIVNFHLANGGMNRFDKFEHIYHNILHRPLESAERQRLGDRFAELVFDKVCKAPFVAGAQEFLSKYYKKLSLFVVSATPQNELRAIIAARKMQLYFTDVLGAPASKTDNIRKIMHDNKLQAEELLFVGDAQADYEGARASDVPFVGRLHSGQNDPFNHLPVEQKISDLHGLETMVRVD